MIKLLCIDDRILKWQHNAVKGRVYTEVERASCADCGLKFVRVAEARVFAPYAPRGYRCPKCKGSIFPPDVRGMFAAFRFIQLNDPDYKENKEECQKEQTTTAKSPLEKSTEGQS